MSLGIIAILVVVALVSFVLFETWRADKAIEEDSRGLLDNPFDR